MTSPSERRLRRRCQQLEFENRELHRKVSAAQAKLVDCQQALRVARGERSG